MHESVRMQFLGEGVGQHRLLRACKKIMSRFGAATHEAGA